MPNLLELGSPPWARVPPLIHLWSLLTGISIWDTKMRPSEMALKCNFRAFLLHWFGKIFWLIFKIFWNGAFGTVSGASSPKIRKSCNQPSPSGQSCNRNLPPPLRGLEIPLNLVLEFSKGFRWGLVRPCRWMRWPNEYIVLIFILYLELSFMPRNICFKGHE